MKNSQVAVLCAADPRRRADRRRHQRLARPLGRRRRRAHPTGTRRRRRAAHRPVIAMMPKAKGDPYFVSCRAGAEEAARELGVDLIWDGPTSLDAAKQNELVENWITRKVDAIAVAVENRAGISTVLRKARERGIQVADLGRRRRARRARLLRQPGDRRGHRQRADRRGGAAARRQGRVRDHHRRAQRGEPERVDRVHQEAARATSIPKLKLVDDPAERRRPRQGVRRDADDPEGLSVGEADHGDLGAGRARRGRGGAAGRPHGRQRDRPVAAEHQQAVRPRRRRADGRPVEHARPRLPDRATPARWSRRTSCAPARARSTAGRLGTIEVRDSQIILGAPLLFNKANIDRFDF